jgi:hypothetical protein
MGIRGPGILPAHQPSFRNQWKQRIHDLVFHLSTKSPLDSSSKKLHGPWIWGAILEHVDLMPPHDLYNLSGDDQA